MGWTDPKPGVDYRVLGERWTAEWYLLHWVAGEPPHLDSPTVLPFMYPAEPMKDGEWELRVQKLSPSLNWPTPGKGPLQGALKCALIAVLVCVLAGCTQKAAWLVLGAPLYVKDKVHDWTHPGEVACVKAFADWGAMNPGYDPADPVSMKRYAAWQAQVPTCD